MAICKHKWIYSRSDSYWRFSGKNSFKTYNPELEIIRKQ